MTLPYFCIFVIITALKRPGPLFEQFCIPFTQGWFVSSLIEILFTVAMFFSNGKFMSNVTLL
jgi:hypothetical protein